ncbi:MAG TPA: MEDS domain-containing protein, partial [Acidimicrobiia bacterium]|nr:MEDS domain-containing protein [Acidimicrobiia bacterium]
MIDSGLPGVTLDDKEHVCVFYRGPEERDTVLAGFLGAGVSEGDKCLCIADSTDAEAVAARLDPHHRRTPDQLTVLPATAYLTDGEFVPEGVISQWDSIIGGWVDDGYRHVRGTGELSWFLRHHRATGGAGTAASGTAGSDTAGSDTAGAGPLLEYEALCNKLVKRRPATIFCLYDLDLLDAGLLPGVLRHHGTALARGVLFRSPRPLTDPHETAADGSGGHPWRIEERPGGADDALLLANLLLDGARRPAEIVELLAGIRSAVLDHDPASGARPGPEAERFLRMLDGLAAPHLRAARLQAELATRPLVEATDAAGLARGLLDGTPGPDDVVRARSLGLDLDSPVRAVVVRPSTGPTPNPPSRIGAVGPAAVVREELAAQGIRVVAIRP